MIPKPYKYQQEVFDFIKNKDQFALFMEQGTGKSKVTIMKTQHLYDKNLIDKVVIIVPNALKFQWVREQFKTHFDRKYSSCVWQNKKTKKFEADFDKFCQKTHLKILSVNIESFSSSYFEKFLKKFLDSSKKEAFIVVDESTTIKNPTAIRSKKIVKGFRRRRFKAILTGTPVPHSPFDLWNQFEFLRENFFKMNYYHFTHRYGIIMKMRNWKTDKSFETLLTQDIFEKVKNEVAGYKINDGLLERLSSKYELKKSDVIKILKSNNYIPYKNMEELNDQIDKITVKKNKKDCLDLPDKVYETLEVELSLEQKRIIKELKKEAVAFYEGKELTVVNIVSMCIRFQQITGGHFPTPVHHVKRTINKEGVVEELYKIEYDNKPIKNNPKIKALQQDLECVSRDTQIIVWAIFVPELKLIHNTLRKDYKCGLIYGSTQTDEREKIIESFKSREIQILIISSSIGQMGLNLQVSNLHYFYSNDYRPDRRLQAEDRSHRIGQKNKVTYKDIICLDSIDQKIKLVLSGKEKIINFFRKKGCQFDF